MEVRMQVIAKPSRKSVASLRKVVAQHLKQIEGDGGNGGMLLRLKSQQKQGRKPGWSKIDAAGHAGVIKIEWDADQRMLLARVETRGSKNRPYKLMGLFVDYLMTHHADRIHSVNMQLL